MKTAVFSFAGLVAGACLIAAMPNHRPPAGGALILDNDQMIEGEIRREGDRVIIRRGSSETDLPAARVVEIVADRKAAVRVMRERSNGRDPDERVRLVRWCLENGLRDEALEEAENLLASWPNDARLKDIAAGLRQIGPTTRVMPATPPQMDSGKVIDVEPPVYNPESFGMFVSKVQPILMNLCISCHGGEKGGSFSLVRADQSDRSAAVHNLSVALKHLNRSKPQESPFLLKSIAAHGNAVRPPLRDRQHPAFANLETWVNLAIVPEDAEPTPAKAVVEPKVKPKSPSPSTRFGELSKSKPLPEPQTEAKDAFDPAIFNGTIQPKK